MNKHINFNQKDKLIAFPYYGGKSYIANWIISHFPKHHAFVDVFGGAANIILNKKLSPIEVYNDVNSQIVNFFKVLREDSKAFIDYLKHIPYSREDYYKYREKLKNDELSDFENAAWFWSIARMSFSGMIDKSWGYVVNSNNPAKQKYNTMQKLELVAKRLMYVIIDNLPFKSIFKNYDSKNTLFYCDPPYYSPLRTTNNVYKNEMTQEDHMQLLEIINECEGKVIISGYENELYCNSLKNWKVDRLQVVKHSKGMTKNTKEKVKPRVDEIIWIKPNCEENKDQLTLF